MVCPSSPTECEANGEEAGRQPQRAPGPRRGDSRQSLSEDATGALPIAAEQFANTEPPRDPVVTPREIGERRGVAAVHMPGWDITPRAAGFHLCGRDEEDDLRVRVIEVPSIQVKRDGAG